MKKYGGIIIVCILGLIPLAPLLHSGFPLTHDGQDHIARIANFYQSLLEGNSVPRWANNLNWGYGHPILMFLYPFPSYLASLFHFLGFTLVDSVKLVFAITYVLSGIGMYLWIKNIWGEKEGIVSAAVYMYAPYRFVDLYVRGAIGEHVAFVFAPFICFFILKLSKKYSYASFLGLSLSIAGLILSHNAVAIMLFPIIFLYALICISGKNKKFFMMLSVSTFIGVGLAFFFVFPAFFEGKYTLRDKVTGNYEYRNSFVVFYKFFDTTWNFGGSQLLSKQIGLPIVFAFFTSLFFTFKSSHKKTLLCIFAGSFLFSLFMMTQWSDSLWFHISLIQKFQFPWRFLSVTIFSGSVLAGMTMYFLKNNKFQKIYFGLILVSSIFLAIPYMKVNGYVTYSDDFYTGIYHGTTDTGESAPVWSVRFMEREAVNPVEVIEGSAQISNYERNTTMRKYNIVAVEPSRIRENTLYFPNWEVFINDKKVDIEYQDELNRGLITYFVPKGKNSVKVIFSETKLRIFANYITIISAILLIGIGLWTIFSRRRKI